MSRAIEKIAEPEEGWASRAIVCHRCGVECAVSPTARLGDTACIGCIQRLERTPGSGAEPGAIRNVASWCDKATAPGPGCGIVECPHCAARCVVEVGGAARTGCAACLRPLGSQPLLRMDLSAPPGPSTIARWDDDWEDGDDVFSRVTATYDHCMRLSD